MSTLREQITGLYGNKRISNMLVLDQAILAGVDVDDEADSELWRCQMVEAAKRQFVAAQTKADLLEAAERNVGWLRHLKTDALPELKTTFASEMERFA